MPRKTVEKKNREALPVEPSKLEQLSARETEVLSYAAAGKLDREICAELGISVNTLRTYWQRIRNKMGDRSRSALAVAYVGRVASQAAPARPKNVFNDYEIDLSAQTFTRLSDAVQNGAFPLGQPIPLKELRLKISPDERESLESLLATVQEGDAALYSFMGRAMDGERLVSHHDYVQVERDAKGKAVWIGGKRFPSHELGVPLVRFAEIGYWKTLLPKRQLEIDEALMQIYRINPRPGDDLRALVRARIHPEERERVERTLLTILSQGLKRSRLTHRLLFEDGEVRWITHDIRIEKEGAYGTVVALP